MYALSNYNALLNDNEVYELVTWTVSVTFALKIAFLDFVQCCWQGHFLFYCYVTLILTIAYI